MRKLGMILTAAIFLVMVTVTVRATREISISAAWADYAANPWAVATLYDAYCGFFIYWMWVAYRERTWAWRILWLVLIMALGNIATSAYLFLQLRRLRPDESIENALVRRKAA